MEKEAAVVEINANGHVEANVAADDYGEEEEENFLMQMGIGGDDCDEIEEKKVKKEKVKLLEIPRDIKT